MIKVDNVTKIYTTKESKVLANKNISFTANPGDMICIRGRSGSGKTTLMNMLTGLDSPQEGKIIFYERDLHSLSDKERTILRRDNMGLMFQHFELLPMLNGYDNIRVPLLLGRVDSNPSNSSRKEIVDEMTQKIRPDIDFLSKKVTQISGGQRQIINILRALFYSSKLIIGDEITSNLDTGQSHQVYQLLRETVEETQCIGIFISHDHIIGEFCSRVFNMEDGILEEI